MKHFFQISLIFVGLCCLLFSSVVSAFSGYDSYKSGRTDATYTIEDKIIGFLYTNDLGFDIYANNLSAFYGGSGIFSVRVMIYAYDGGVLLGNSSNHTVAHYGEHTIGFDSPVLLESGRSYWMCFWSNLSASLSSFLYFNSTGTNKMKYDNEVFTSGVCPNPWSNTTLDNTASLSYVLGYDFNTIEHLFENHVMSNGTLEFLHNSSGFWAWSNVTGNYTPIFRESDNVNTNIVLEPMVLFFLIWLCLIVAIHKLHSRYYLFHIPIGILQLFFVVANYQLLMGLTLFPIVYLNVLFVVFLSVFVLLYAMWKAEKGFRHKEGM